VSQAGSLALDQRVGEKQLPTREDWRRVDEGRALRFQRLRVAGLKIGPGWRTDVFHPGIVSGLAHAFRCEPRRR